MNQTAVLVALLSISACGDPSSSPSATPSPMAGAAGAAMEEIVTPVAIEGGVASAGSPSSNGGSPVEMAGSGGQVEPCTPGEILPLDDPGNEGDGHFTDNGPYEFGPDSFRKDGVPEGTVRLNALEWNDSQIFPGTQRSIHYYEPAQYDPATPAAVMVFLDGDAGWAYLGDPNGGEYKTIAVLDNLIAEGRIPVSIGVFVDHGGDNNCQSNCQRRFEYDTVHDLNARFILEEILPEAEKEYNLTHDPEGRAIIGESSGGIAAFTAGWFRPNEFRRIMSHSGSFVDLAGGHVYPELIRAEPAKPLRVFMNDGTNDYDRGENLDWVAGNQAVAEALRDQGYHYRFLFGTTDHGGPHGHTSFPESLEWLWRGYVPAEQRTVVCP